SASSRRWCFASWRWCTSRARWRTKATATSTQASTRTSRHMPTKSFLRRNEMKRFGKIVVGFSTAVTAMLVAMPAFAEGTADAAAFNDRDKWIAVAAGFGIALAAFGGALSQGRAASTALDGIARNPGAADKLFTPMIIGLALIESLVIYSLIISFLLLGKVH